MIVQIEKDLNKEFRNKLKQEINSFGFKVTEVVTGKGTYLVCIGPKDFDIRKIGKLDGVRDVHRVSDDYKLVSRKWKINPSSIAINGTTAVTEGELSIMAGPCSVESEEQVEKIADHLVEAGINIMRGGVFKPRSSPYAFRGLGIEGLKMFHSICKRKNIKIISEVMQVSQIDAMHDYVDIFQVGARNSQNFNLLDELGKIQKPVLLKRGLSGTIDELLYSAEYIFSSGNENLILCERGIRTYENSYRNTFDINAIALLKEKTHLPVIADPSHGVGIRKFVEPIALAAVMAGADGVIYEVHEKPEEALSDGQQTLNFTESLRLAKKLRQAFSLKTSFA